jgi:hypothetical protein
MVICRAQGLEEWRTWQGCRERQSFDQFVAAGVYSIKLMLGEWPRGYLGRGIWDRHAQERLQVSSATRHGPGPKAEVPISWSNPRCLASYFPSVPSFAIPFTMIFSTALQRNFRTNPEHSMGRKHEWAPGSIPTLVGGAAILLVGGTDQWRRDPKQHQLSNVPFT